MKKIIEKFNSLNIVVIGDVMLDIFTYGISERLSPEAPVPIIRIDQRKFCAGGAGNVSNNLQALGIKNYLFGVIGDDSAAQQLTDILSVSAIDNYLCSTPNRPTTTKDRFIAGTQQLLRVDHESTEKISADLEITILENLKTLLNEKKIDAIIFSDYNKGTLSNKLVADIMELAANQNIITALDPKPNSIEIPKNLTILKPNRKEAFNLANMSDNLFGTKEERLGLLEKAAKIIYDRYQPEYLVISLSADGIAIYQDGKLSITPTAAKEVFDVSGAGDTLLSTLVGALAAGGTILESTSLANISATIAVSKSGTSSVSADELLRAIPCR